MWHRYVVGFAFDEARQRVVLVRKNRPRWQAGRLNGVGGKVEPGEDYPAAVAREFEEEAGIRVEASRWEHVLTYVGLDYEVRFFRTVIGEDPRSVTDEAVAWHEVAPVGVMSVGEVIGNLRWIVPMCLDPHLEIPVLVHERIR